MLPVMGGSIKHVDNSECKIVIIVIPFGTFPRHLNSWKSIQSEIYMIVVGASYFRIVTLMCGLKEMMENGNQHWFYSASIVQQHV
jgi:hypothetical protein